MICLFIEDVRTCKINLNNALYYNDARCLIKNLYSNGYNRVVLDKVITSNGKSSDKLNSLCHEIINDKLYDRNSWIHTIGRGVYNDNGGMKIRM